jgi:hypothetical protein
MPVEISTESYYVSFHTINFPCFLPYFFPVLHVMEWYVKADVKHNLLRIASTVS